MSLTLRAAEPCKSAAPSNLSGNPFRDDAYVGLADESLQIPSGFGATTQRK